MAPRVKSIGIVFALASVASVGGCQSTLLSDSRIESNTAGILGVPPDEVTISNRRSDGATNTYYTAQTRSGKKYACTINGGGILAVGMVNAPTCSPVAGNSR